jgi:hypothetical protein
MIERLLFAIRLIENRGKLIDPSKIDFFKKEAFLTLFEGF